MDAISPSFSNGWLINNLAVLRWGASAYHWICVLWQFSEHPDSGLCPLFAAHACCGSGAVFAVFWRGHTYLHAPFVKCVLIFLGVSNCRSMGARSEAVQARHAVETGWFL